MFGAWVSIKWALRLLGGGSDYTEDYTLDNGDVWSVRDGVLESVNGVDASLFGWEGVEVGVDEF